MNAEAILTPGGIADQLTRGLSGLGQSFAQRENLLYQGQRDRVADDRYVAEMALRQQELARRDARQALEAQRYQQELAFRQQQEQRVAADRELERQTKYPELYQASPSPQVSSRAADALRRREFEDARAGYVPPERMQVLPDQQDWRVPMAPGERMYGPPAGSPAAQGFAARPQPTTPMFRRDPLDVAGFNASARDDQNEKAFQRKLLQDQIRSLEGQLAEANNAAQGILAPSIDQAYPGKHWYGGGTYTAEDVAASPLTKQKMAADMRVTELTAQLNQLRASAMGGAAGALGAPANTPVGDWKSRAAGGFKQFVTP